MKEFVCALLVACTLLCGLSIPQVDAGCTKVIFGGKIDGDFITCHEGFTKVPLTGRAVCNHDIGLYSQTCQQRVVSDTAGVPTYVAISYGGGGDPYAAWRRLHNACPFYNMTAPTLSCGKSKECDDVCRQYHNLFPLGGFEFPIWGPGGWRQCNRVNIAPPTYIFVCKLPGRPQGKCLPMIGLIFSPQRTTYDTNDTVQSKCPGGFLVETLTCLPTGEWTIRYNPCKRCNDMITEGGIRGDQITCVGGFTKMPPTGRASCNQDLGLYNQTCRNDLVSRTYGTFDYGAVALGPPFINIPSTYSRVKNACAYYGMSPPTAADCNSSKVCNDICQHYQRLFPQGFNFTIAYNLVAKCQPATGFNYTPASLIICVDRTCLPNPILNFSPQKARYAIGESVPTKCRGGSHVEVLTCLPTGLWTNRLQPCIPCSNNIYGGRVDRHREIVCRRDLRFYKFPSAGRTVCNEDVGLYSHTCRRPVEYLTGFVAVGYGPAAYSRAKTICAFYNLTAPTAACATSIGCDHICKLYGNFFSVSNFPIGENITRGCNQDNVTIGTMLVVCQATNGCLPNPKLSFSPVKASYAVGEIVPTTCPGGDKTEQLTCLASRRWTKSSLTCKACTGSVFGYYGQDDNIVCALTGLKPSPFLTCNGDIGLFRGNQACQVSVVSTTRNRQAYVAVAQVQLRSTFSRAKEICATYYLGAPSQTCGGHDSGVCDDVCTRLTAQIGKIALSFAVGNNLFRNCSGNLVGDGIPLPVVVCADCPVFIPSGKVTNVTRANNGPSTGHLICYLPSVTILGYSASLCNLPTATWNNECVIH